jgi:hypothetical protein
MGTLCRGDVAGFAGNVMKSSNYRVASLAEWLEIATDGIAAAGRERIAREIEVHFAEAVESHLAQGETEEAAKDNALRDLGDAKTARRKFRKRHLTAKEEHRLDVFQYEAGSKLELVIFLILDFGGTVALLTIGPKGSLIFCVLIFPSVMIFPIFTFWKLRQPESKSNLYSASLLELSQAAFFCLVFALLACVRFKGSFFCGMILMTVWIPRLFQSFWTWKKFRKNESPAIGT